MQKMKSPLLLAFGAIVLAGPLSGCHFMASGGGALLGNLFVLAVTVGIFFGTLGLGRSTTGPRTGATSTADRSQSEQPRA